VPALTPQSDGETEEDDDSEGTGPHGDGHTIDHEVPPKDQTERVRDSDDAQERDRESVGWLHGSVLEIQLPSNDPEFCCSGMLQERAADGKRTAARTTAPLSAAILC
jgi:hypothetical protein